MNTPNQASARRTLVFRSSAIVVAVAVVAAIAGWQFYGTADAPPAPDPNPTEKVGTGNAPSNNPLTTLDKR